MLENDKPVGLLRYNLFWDNTPFCTILFIDWNNQKSDRPRFQTARFPEFWQSAIPANEGKKMPKPSARANQMLIGVPILKHEPETDLTNFLLPFTI